MSKPRNPRVTDLWAEDGCIYGYIDDALVCVWTPPGDDTGTAARVVAMLDASAPAEVARVTPAVEVTGEVFTAESGHTDIAIGRDYVRLPPLPGATVGDAVIVTVRKG